MKRKMSDCPLDFQKTPEEFVYDTDESYQKMFQQFFKFHDNIEEIGDIYDVDQVKIGMNYILARYAGDDWWNKILVKAAGMFLSEDVELGLCVCLNYSFFEKFYRILHCIEKDPENSQLAEFKTDLENALSS